MRRVIGGKICNTETARLLADNEFKDGTNRLTNGRATYLYRAPQGSYFAHHVTCWQGERDWIEPLLKADAIELYERINDAEAVEFEAAFPGAEIEEA